MDAPVLRKITAKLHPTNGQPSTSGSSPRPPSRNARAPSPSKGYGSGSMSPPTGTLSPSFRPKAKVNSSATVVRKGTTPSITPRANTPNTRPTAATSAPRQVKARATTTAGVVRPTLKPQLNPSVNTPPPHRIFPPNYASDNGLPSPGRARHGSLSLHHAASYSSLHARSPSGSHSSVMSEETSSSIGGPRFKSKVSSGATVSATSGLAPSLSTSSSPPYANPRARIRSPSIGTSSPQQPFSLPNSPAPETQQQLFYPITSATSAANPHRYAVSRPPPPHQHTYQSFVEPNGNNRGPFDFAVTPKVDPTSIPLPLHSPPNSAVSYSSRSSLSRSSVSHNTDTSTGQTSSLRSGLDSLGLDLHPSASMTGPTETGDFDDEEDAADTEELESEDPELDVQGPERQIKREAKSNRKIADLEITNRSLMTINALLESTKHRQAKEIRELKRKLRESRLILPPRAYQAVKEKEDEPDELSEEEEDEDEAVDAPSGDRADEVYSRLKRILDTLIVTGKRALETRPDDFKESPKGGKVLSAEEVANWRGGSRVVGLGLEGLDDGDMTIDMTDAGDVSLSSPSQVAVPESDDEDYLSEKEVEALMFEPDFMPRAISPVPPPGIRISLSP